jgi:hypothetical protein
MIAKKIVKGIAPPSHGNTSSSGVVILHHRTGAAGPLEIITDINRGRPVIYLVTLAGGAQVVTEQVMQVVPFAHRQACSSSIVVFLCRCRGQFVEAADIHYGRPASDGFNPVAIPIVHEFSRGCAAGVY